MGVLALIFVSGELHAARLTLKNRAKVAPGFIELNHLIKNPKDRADFKEPIYLGKIEKGTQKKINLSYIRGRLYRSGYITLFPQLENNSDHIIVEAIEIEKPIVPKSKSKIHHRENSSSKVKPPKAHQLFRYLAVKDSVPRGKEITREMLQYREVNRYNRRGIELMEEVLGKTTTRSLHKGTILQAQFVRTEPDVKKNQAVKIALIKGTLKITGIVRALEDGHLGDIITVRRKRQTIRAKVTGKGSVTAVKEI